MKAEECEKLNYELNHDHISFMVKQLWEGKTGKYTGAVMALVLPYKDARVDMDILDEVCGPFHWQNAYKRDDKGVLQGGIGIYVDELNDWVWKWSNGTPSDQEPEKGEYSDAFKRAGYMWGIGRCLYNFPKIVVQLSENEYTYKEDRNGISRLKATNSLRPNEWIWKVTEGFQKITAHKYYGQTKKLRYDSNPYDSQNPRKK